MTDISTLRTLLSDLEALNGPSREIDARLVKAFAPGAIIAPYPCADDDDCVFHAQELGIADKSSVPALTGNTDHAVELCDCVLPHTTIRLTISGPDTYLEISGHHRDHFSSPWFSWSNLSSPAHALCKAIVKAEIARREV